MSLFIPSNVPTDAALLRRYLAEEFNKVNAAKSDVEYGVWVPRIAGTTTPGTQTYSTQFGRWSKYGFTVNLHFRVNMTAKDGATAGNIVITDFPFPVEGAAIAPFAGAIYSNNLTLTAGHTWVVCIPSPGFLSKGIYECGSGVAAAILQAAALANTTHLIGTLQYLTNLE